MANTVNIYDPGWIFFFVFFLVLNFFLAYHHYKYHKTTGSVVKYVQQKINFRKTQEVAKDYKQTAPGMIGKLSDRAPSFVP